MTTNQLIIDTLFPFHFILDSNLNIKKKGKSLKKLMPKSGNFKDNFRFIRPGIGIEYNIESIRSYSNQIFILEGLNCPKKILLKGQFVYIKGKDYLTFCGSPWITHDREITEMGLSLGDFALSDSVVDMIQIIKTIRMEHEDRLILSKEIENQRHFFASLFDILPVEVCLLDKNLKIIFINNFAKLDEEEKKLITNKNFVEYLKLKVIKEKDINNTLKLINEVAITGEHKSFEESCARQLNNDKIMLRFAMPIKFQNMDDHILTYAIDITSLKKNRDELMAKNDELEKANYELDNLVYSITHDLRNPILSSKGLLNLIISQDDLHDNQRTYLGLMRDSLERLDKTILEILTYSKNSRLEVSYSEINLRPIVTEAFNSVKYLVDYPIELNIEVKEEAPFISDIHRITPLINNLISNAVRYSKNTQLGSEILFKAQINKQRCFIEVSDNGEGIAPEHQDKVFRIFYRASGKGNGTGLGLFICSEVVKKLGGTISLNSTLGIGTTFSILLPNNLK